MLLPPLGTAAIGLSTDTEDAEERVGVDAASFTAAVEPDINNHRRCRGSDAGSVLTSSTTGDCASETEE